MSDYINYMDLKAIDLADLACQIGDYKVLKFRDYSEEIIDLVIIQAIGCVH